MAAIALLAAFGLPGGSAFVAVAATTERVVVNRHTGLAIAGFDPVAYFTDHQPRLGEAEFEATESGAVWRFCNSGNRAFFLARPDIYAPQFGGYDPVDVARGVAVAGDPLVWLVTGQRLYLFSREESRDAFAAKPEVYLSEARHYWPRLLAGLAE